MCYTCVYVTARIGIDVEVESFLVVSSFVQTTLI